MVVTDFGMIDLTSRLGDVQKKKKRRVQVAQKKGFLSTPVEVIDIQVDWIFWLIGSLVLKIKRAHVFAISL